MENQVQEQPSQFRQEVKNVASQLVELGMAQVRDTKEFKLVSLALPRLKTLPYQLTSLFDNYTDEEIMTFLDRGEEAIQWLKSLYKSS